MAALGEPLKERIHTQASCPACGGFYREPVLLSCGTSYCRACVAQLSPAECPDCGVAFEVDRLTANHNLARLVELARALLEEEERRQGEAGEATGGGEGGSDEEACKEAVFCKQHKTVICPDCYVPEDHRGHDVVLVDSATEQYQLHVQNCLSRLRREKRGILMNRTTLEVDFENCVAQVTEAWEKTKAEFQELEDFLERQKGQLLTQVTEMYKEINMNKNEHLSAIYYELNLIGNIACEMEDATKLPKTEFLENIGEIMKPFEERETVQLRGSLSCEIQRKVSGLVDLHMFLLSSMKQFRENVTSGLNQHRGLLSTPTGITTPDPNGTDPSAIMEKPQDN